MNRVHSQAINFEISQKFDSLDVIQVQSFLNMTNDNYFLGMSNLTKTTPYTTAERYLIGNFQFEMDNK